MIVTLVLGVVIGGDRLRMRPVAAGAALRSGARTAPASGEAP
jgi:hypothetical protein